MKWLLSSIGSTALAAFLAHAAVEQEPASGIELVLGEACPNAATARLGTFEIDGLERAVSARATLSTGVSSLELSVPPGLYGIRFVPDPDSPAPTILAMDPAVFLVAPRTVARVDVRFRVVASRSQVQ